VKFLNKSVAELQINSEKGGAGLRALRFSAEDFKKVGNDVNKLLPEIIQRFAEMPAGPEKTKVALNLLGKAGTNLIPTLNDLGKNGGELIKKFEEMGLVVGPRFIENAIKFDNATDDMNGRIQGLKLAIGGELMPVVTEMIKRFSDWIARNKELIVIKVKEFVEALGVTVENLGRLMGALSTATTGASESTSAFGRIVVIFNRGLQGTVNLVGMMVNSYLSYMKTVRSIAGAMPDWLVGDNTANLAEQDKAIKDVEATLKSLEQTFNDVKKTTDDYEFSINNQNKTLDLAKKMLEDMAAAAFGTGNAFKESGADMDAFTSGTKQLTEAEKELKKAKEEQARIDEQALEQVQSLTKSWTEAADTFGMTSGEVRNYTLRTIEANAASLGLSAEGLAAVKKALEEAAIAASNINFKEGVQSAMEEIDAFGAHISESLEGGVDSGKEAFDSLSDFIGDVTANISDTIANMLTAAFTGGFDDVMRSWKDMLKNMLNIFFQFVAAIITNPIRISLEGALSGGAGTGNILGDIGKTVTGLFGDLGKSFGALGSLFGIGGGIGSIGEAISGASALASSLEIGGTALSTGFGATLSAAIPAIGAIISAAMIAIPLIIDAFKKTPRLDIDFDTVKDEMGKRAAFVSEIMDEDFFKDVIAQISVKRKAGLGVGGDDAIKDIIFDALKSTIDAVQAIINKLPSDLAAFLNEALVNTQIDTSTIVGGERLLEFDAKGKKLKEKFEAFINGELQAKFLMSISDFFEGAYEALGVLPGKAQEMLDQQMEDFKNAGSREARAEIGKEALAQFNAFVDAFNFAAGRFGDSAGEAISQIKALAVDLGFEGIPTFKEMSAAVKELLANAEINPETIEKFKALRQAIAELGLSLSSTAISLVQFIDTLNTKIVSLGGSAIDTSVALQETIDSLVALINSGGLSFAELQQAFQQLGSALDLQFAKELERAQAAAAKQQAAIQKQVNAKQEQLRLVTEKTNAEIDGLKAALDFAERFRDLAESIKQDLRNLFTGPNSALTGIEKLNFLQGEVAAAAQRLARATTQEGKLEAIGGLRDLQNELIDLGTSAFGTSSPEFQALFRETADRLQALVDKANAEGLKTDSLQDKITRLQDKLETQTEKLNASIRAAQDKLADLGAQEVKLSGAAAEKLRQTYEWLRDQAAKALEEANKALKELGVDTSVLEPQLAVASEQLTVMREGVEVSKEIRDLLSNLSGFEGGSGGFQDFGSGTLAVMHGREAVIRPEDLGSLRGGLGELKFSADIQLSGDASDSSKRFVAKEIVRSFEESLRSGTGREIVKEIVRGR